MISIGKVQNGVSAYIESEFLNKLGGWQKWVFGAAAAMLLSDATKIVDKIKDNEIVKIMGVIDADGAVDVEKLYRYFKQQAQKGSITFDAPILGAVTMNESDVDKLYSFIMR